MLRPDERRADNPAIGPGETALRAAAGPGKRISIVLPDLRGGGAERVSIDLARALAALGYQVDFALLDAVGEFLGDARRDFPFVDLGVTRARWAVPGVVSYLRAHRPGAVIAMMWPLTVIVPVAARLARLDTRVLVCEHSTISRQYRDCGLAHNMLLRASTAVGYRLAHGRAGVSGGVARDMASLACLSSSRVATLHNPVPLKQRPGEQEIAGAHALWSGAGPRLLTVGSFKPTKNYPLLLRAFAKLDSPGARLMVLGQGEGEAKLRALALELGIADRVIFAGFQADPSVFYATADMFVLSSDLEGLPTVLIEALSFGLPVVSTDCPSGPAEILENGRWGRLVPMGDAGALARGMAEALGAPVDREALRRRAADFSPEIAARRYLTLLGFS